MDSKYVRVNRDDFVHTWLIQQDPSSAYTAFRHIPLAEVDDARELVFVLLAETIFIHHNDPEEFRKNVITLGYPEAAEEVDRRPHDPTTRKGNFGEILASEYLRQCEGYRIPVYRLRKSSEDSPMPGEDILAFKFGAVDGSDRVLLVGESKVRGQYESRAVEEAYQQLCKSGRRPRPKSFLFIVHILREQNRDDEADQVLMFLNKFAPHQPARRYMIFLVTGNAPQDPFYCIQEREDVIENLIAANLCIPNLDDFVNALFDHEVTVDGTRAGRPSPG